MFKSDFFAGNRRRLQKKFSPDSLFIFTANGLLQRSGSTTYPFRQDSSFWYLTGLEEPDIVLVMQGSEEFLILPERNKTFELFNGRPEEADMSGKSGIEKILNHKAGMEQLKSALAKSPEAVTLLPLDIYVQAAGFYAGPARRRLQMRLKRIKPSLKLTDARRELSALRMVKQEPELLAIEAAVSITETTFNKLKQSIDSFATEKDVLRSILSQFLALGADGPAYDTIAASGKNACILHYLPKDYPLRPGELVLIDAGAEIHNYAADITRTYAVSQPSPRQQEVYSAVMEIRQYALDLLKPGISLKEYEKMVKARSAQIIKRLGLNGEPAGYYPHATSHFMGLDVHDPGNPEAKLESGVVLTVEPGIYIKEEKIGIRIEDNILITKNGHKNLSQNLSRELK